MTTLVIFRLLFQEGQAIPSMDVYQAGHAALPSFAKSGNKPIATYSSHPILRNLHQEIQKGSPRVKTVHMTDHGFTTIRYKF